MIDQEDMADYTCAFGPERIGDPWTAILVKGAHLSDGLLRCVTSPLTKLFAESLSFEVRPTARTISAPTAACLRPFFPPCIAYARSACFASRYSTSACTANVRAP